MRLCRTISGQPVGAILRQLLLLWTSCAVGAGPAPAKECVVLLHGLYRTGLSMLAVEWKLEAAGYVVSNVSYPSLTHPIE